MWAKTSKDLLGKYLNRTPVTNTPIWAPSSFYIREVSQAYTKRKENVQQHYI